jgi:lipopolysaccharide transport system ATP-binding protein
MKQLAIKAENISKQYRLGEVGTGTISHDLNRFWCKIRGKENPYLKIGDNNNRTSKGNSDYVWSLRDINFEVQQGDAVGIIGRNGAGKSTLLKLLSKVTKPTTGSFKVNGRIASLLEVGTGFNPEMTGRENIYLNGAILGMRRHEITRKFDEIVAFSGVERYIDTPVKRYSSGMYVRLAFAVAAHLESEILIVDEVLAVGDAEFQKKCLGKMGDVSKSEGRTVLFVSHNMTAVETLCNKAIFLNNGYIDNTGTPNEMIKYYLEYASNEKRSFQYDSMLEAEGNEYVRIVNASVENASSDDVDAIIDVTSEIDLHLKIVNLTKEVTLSVGFDLKTLKGDTLFGTGQFFDFEIGKATDIKCRIPSQFLNDELYQIHFYIHTKAMSMLYSNDLLIFEVKDVERISGYLGKISGLIRPKLNWTKE